MDNPHARCRVYYIYQTMCVCMCDLCTQPYAGLQLTLCLTLVLGTAITFTLRLWLCSGIALRAQGSCSCTAQVQGTHLFLMALHSEWLLNVINLASLRFHVSSLSQRNCFRSCQLQFVTSCQLPVADAVAVAVARCSLCSHGASFWLVVLAIVLALSLS